MRNANLISALRNMVDDIENLGAAPFTVDVNVLRQAIAALTPPEGYVLVPVELTDTMWTAGYSEIHDFVGHTVLGEVWAAMIAARPEVK